MAAYDKMGYWRCAKTFSSDSRAIGPYLDEVTVALENRGWNPQDVFAVRLALDEAVANAIEHGNRRDPTKKIQATAEITQNRALISIQDDGGGFAQDAVNDPTLDENIEQPHGRGLFLIKNFMTRVWHNEKGNVIYMEKSPQ